MFKKSKWLAAIEGENWVVAKIKRHDTKLRISRIEKYYPARDDISLKSWLKQHKVNPKGIRIALSCSGIITRIITLPKLKEGELTKLLINHVDQYFTFNSQDYLIDFRIVNHFQEDGQEKIKVLLAALPKYKWEAYLRQWEECGIRPKVVDLGVDSLVRLYGLLSKSLGDKREDVAIVNLNHNRIDFILLERGLFYLQADLEFNVEQLMQPEIELDNELLPVLQNLSEFINFFASRHYGKSIDIIYLIGPNANMPYLSEAITDQIGIRTIVGFPGSWKPSFEKGAQKDELESLDFGSLYGLAFRED